MVVEFEDPQFLLHVMKRARAGKEWKSFDGSHQRMRFVPFGYLAVAVPPEEGIGLAASSAFALDRALMTLRET